MSAAAPLPAGSIQTILVPGLTNREFLERHARPGCVGLAAGTSLVDKAIARAQRSLSDPAGWGRWSHAFVFEGARLDGHQWVVESDLQIHRKHIQLGVQENRAAKFFDKNTWSGLAVLDFGLTAEQTSAVLREGLDLVAAHVRYSVRELLGTLLAIKRPELRGRENLLARDRCFFCSAFVHHLFRRAGIDLLPGVNVKHAAPEDLARSTRPHTKYLFQRAACTEEVSKGGEATATTASQRRHLR